MPIFLYVTHLDANGSVPYMKKTQVSVSFCATAASVLGIKPFGSCYPNLP